MRLGDGITDDTLLHIAHFLPTARDLLSLRLSCRRFNIRCIVAPSQPGRGCSGSAEMLCIADEAARLWLAGCSEQERGWVPRRDLECRLGQVHEVELLRVPLAFGRAQALFTLSEGGAVTATKTAGGYVLAGRGERGGDAGRTTLRTVHDDTGQRHDLRRDPARLGRGWREGRTRSVWTATVSTTRAGGATYPTGIPSNHNWEGRQPAVEHGDRIGLLLDLDQGSMTVWKSDVKLGVMVAEGLSGPLCWAVSLARIIKSAPAPASPTAEELAAADAWLTAH